MDLAHPYLAISVINTHLQRCSATNALRLWVDQFNARRHLGEMKKVVCTQVRKFPGKDICLLLVCLLNTNLCNRNLYNSYSFRLVGKQFISVSDKGQCDLSHSDQLKVTVYVAKSNNCLELI
jgi:hypothetical protein